MATRKAKTKIEKRKTVERMITRVSGPPPYEWVSAAIERFASDLGLTRADACCVLLDSAMKRDLSEIRVLRPFPVSRGASGERGGAEKAMIPSFSISAAYGGLQKSLDDALALIRAQHIERARMSAKSLAKDGLGSEVWSVRGWRAEVRTEGTRLGGFVLQIANTHKLDDDDLANVCDVVTDDMTAADVMRALWADELEREGLAPKGWSSKRQVGVGWIHFAEREVR